MIISRTPFRVSLAGGGSDLEDYYRQRPGHVVTTAINRYMYVTVNPRFDDSIRVSYTRTEIVDHVDDLQHDLIRESMKMTGLTKGIEITTIADLPAGIGLGSSSTLTVGVLNALYAMKAEWRSPADLARQACEIEIEVLRKPIGKQDQYIAAFGGLQDIRFLPDGTVRVHPVICSGALRRRLAGRLLLFYTGVHRDAGTVLGEARERLRTELRQPGRRRRSRRDGGQRPAGDRVGTHRPRRRSARRELEAEETDGVECVERAPGRGLRSRAPRRRGGRQNLGRRRRRVPAAVCAESAAQGGARGHGSRGPSRGALRDRTRRHAHHSLQRRRAQYPAAGPQPDSGSRAGVSAHTPLRTVRRAALLAVMLCGLAFSQALALQIAGITATPSPSVPRYARLEIAFQIAGSTATDMQWPYDERPPRGVPPGTGITVNAVFTDPDGRRFTQPAFYSQEFRDEVREGRDWHLPTGHFGWKVRFSPDRVGAWTYRIVAVDRGGAVESPVYSFTVTASDNKGFVRVSKADPRYFEFEDGSPFHAMGLNLPDLLGRPLTEGAPAYERLSANGVNLVRVWVSSLYGSAWNGWIGGRNQYRGYLPVTGLVPFRDAVTDRTTLAMKLDYEAGGDTGWFDACRMQLWWEDQAESVKPHTRYRLRIEYSGEGISGPRNPAFRNYGLVAKVDDRWLATCHEAGMGAPATAYGGNTTGFGSIEGTWDSGNASFLPRMYLALENVLQGAAYVRSVSLREDLGDGAFGAEMMVRPSMEHHLYVPEERAYSLDKIVEHAERNGVYLKLVVMDLNDKIYLKMAGDGSWATADNLDGFYGLGRGMNKTRWLQQMWWRYAQARWGYSPSIHSWELTNEGDPNLTTHYQLADEFGKFMHCRAFGVEPGLGDGKPCSLKHPNAHMVTTSFWKGFPAREFWSNARYPNVDYADVHAYVSTSFAPDADRELMQHDAALYHAWHSEHLASMRIRKPIVRGEAGLDSPDEQSETVLGLDRDSTGVWLHNFLWAGLDSGALHELYWWNSHIWANPADIIRAYRTVSRFLSDVPLNRGGYVDWGGTVTNPSLRVVGQKNPGTGAMHLWVQNRAHTWKNVVDGVAIQPASGSVTVPGFKPGAAYALERWDTHAAGGRLASVGNVVADSAGSVTISVSLLLTDAAFKIQADGARAPRVRTGGLVKWREQ